MDTALPAADRSVRAPRLLLLVFGIFLMLVGITGSALVAVTSAHLAGTTMGSVLDRDRSLVDLFANDNLTLRDLSQPIGPGRERHLRSQLDALARSDGIRSFRVIDATGTVVVGTGVRMDAPISPSRVRDALDGEAHAEMAEHAGGSVLVEYLPLVAEDGTVPGAAVLERDMGAVMVGLDAARRDVLLVTVLAATVLAAVLVLVFRAAHERIGRQQRQIAEAARRDTLTGMLSHGTTVAELSDLVEAAHAGSTPIAMALIDIDNFRLFNDTHGHEAGDAVLLRVAELVREAAGSGDQVGRYGPDEFIVVQPGRDADALAARMRRLQEAVRSVTIHVADSEALPVSVSIGIAAVPAHASAVTPLLSEASIALTEAKSSGGDAVVIGRVGEERHLSVGGYDVLQGLVLAVDTKDRYTKRHSEDVAKYAVWLARRLGHDEMLETVRLAGLLHDVGKIGIPDQLLRKPSRLTEAEVKIFNQHVALGDAIVRDLPDVDEVRAGIRHHHERWDGGGYLDGLAGEAIPLVARIIAVADTFSAMTTTRPYRKALPVEEALRRLREAGGTQLQPELVDAFVTGMEEDPAAPTPNESSDVWLPLRVA